MTVTELLESVRRVGVRPSRQNCRLLATGGGDWPKGLGEKTFSIGEDRRKIGENGPAIGESARQLGTSLRNMGKMAGELGNDVRELGMELRQLGKAPEPGAAAGRLKLFALKMVPTNAQWVRFAGKRVF